MFWNDFPHTDFHELNLDYLLRVIKEIKAELAEIDISGMKEDIAANAAAITALQTSLGQLNDTVKDLSDTVDDHFEYFDDLIAQVAASVTTAIELLKSYSDAGDEAVKAQLVVYVNSQIRTLQAQIDDLYEKLEEYPENISLYNEGTGYFNSLQFTVNDLWNGARVAHGYTAAEYAAEGLTVEEYSALNMSAREYLMIGKMIVHRYYKWFTNAMTGIKNTVENLHSWSITELFNTPTSAEYDELELTCEAFEELGLTVVEWLQYGTSTRNVVTGGGEGLTAAQYDTLQLL